MPRRPTSITSGIDIGARSVKIAILSHRGAKSSVLAKAVVPVLGSHDAGAARAAMRDGWARALAEANLSAWGVDYVASTGAPDRHVARVGHFYGHLSHALGGRLLFPDATVAIDIGFNQIRCDLLGDTPSEGLGVAGREFGYGEGLLDALVGRAGLPLDDPHAPPLATALSESMAARAAALLRALAVEGKVVLTGGMALADGFARSLRSRLLESGSNVSLLISPDALFAGAYGAAILAARRFDRLSCAVGPAVTDPFLATTRHPDYRSLN